MSGVNTELRLAIQKIFIDMLFYHIRLHCYVVVEVKITEFEASYTGQLGTYVVAVNHQLKTDTDAPTLGLLVCKSKDNVKAQYALESSSQPLGVSAYELSNLMPEKFQEFTALYRRDRKRTSERYGIKESGSQP